VRTIILPKRNTDDLDDLPPDVRDGLTVIPVERIDDVLSVALREPVVIAQHTEPVAVSAN
jgi:ATP-dependent Lon protease